MEIRIKAKICCGASVRDRCVVRVNIHDYSCASVTQLNFQGFIAAAKACFIEPDYRPLMVSMEIMKMYTRRRPPH